MIRKIIKFVYNSMPFKKYLLLFIRSLYIPKQSLFQHLTFKGTFRVALENSNFFKRIEEWIDELIEINNL